MDQDSPHRSNSKNRIDNITGHSGMPKCSFMRLDRRSVLHLAFPLFRPSPPISASDSLPGNPFVDLCEAGRNGREMRLVRTDPRDLLRALE